MEKWILGFFSLIMFSSLSASPSYIAVTAEEEIYLSDKVNTSVRLGDELDGSLWIINSPSGTVQAFLRFENGSLSCKVLRDNHLVVDNSALGLKTNLGDFSTGLTYSGATAATQINESYSVASRKKDVYTNRALERTFSFTKENVVFRIVMRAYDDGLAFRYVIENQSNSVSLLNITGENTVVNVPAGSKTWSQPHNDGWFCYEGEFTETHLSNLIGTIALPMLYQTSSGVYALITEADLGEVSAGSMLNSTGSGLMTYSFTQQQGSSPLSAVVPYQSPWRLCITGDLAHIVESTMVENVATEPDPNIDFSWVKPGSSSWMWLVNYDGQTYHQLQHNKEAIMAYIDLAAEMNWQYFILDDGWQPKNPSGDGYLGYYDWFPEVLAHAERRGVGLIAWVNCNDLDTQAKRDTRLPEWAKMGIKGIKVDFFDSEAQGRMKLYYDIYKQCAQNKLIVNAHGANKPTGEVRTWPNVVSREGVRGEEYTTIHAYQYTILSYIRGAVGPADLTERVTPHSSSSTTAGSQVALSVLVQSGLHVYASSIDEYRNSPAYPLLKTLPAVWDETKFVDGYPGEFISIRRRSGDDWYAAGITATARNAVFDLSFLGSGQYYATIYKDGGTTKTGMDTEIIAVSNEDKLSIPMKENGGCVIKITKIKPIDLSASSLPRGAYLFCMTKDVKIK